MAEKKKKKTGKAATSAVAAVTAAGMVVGGAFASPQDILDTGPDAIVQTVALNAAKAVDDGDGGAGPDGGLEEEAAATEEEKRGVYASARKLVRAAPVEARALVAVPLWALGTGVNALLSALWSAVLSPLASTVVSWAALALTAVLVFALAVKTAFPDLPLKKILNKRSILTIVSLCLLFGLADALLPLFWDDYAQLSKVLKAVGSLICTGVPVAFFVRRHKKPAMEEITAEVAEEPEPEPELTPEEKDAAARALIEELADSVCPKTHY